MKENVQRPKILRHDGASLITEGGKATDTSWAQDLLIIAITRKESVKDVLIKVSVLPDATGATLKIIPMSEWLRHTSMLDKESYVEGVVIGPYEVQHKNLAICIEGTQEIWPTMARAFKRVQKTGDPMFIKIEKV